MLILIYYYSLFINNSISLLLSRKTIQGVNVLLEEIGFTLVNFLIIFKSL